jgi:hypothetical protein
MLRCELTLGQVPKYSILPDGDEKCGVYFCRDVRRICEIASSTSSVSKRKKRNGTVAGQIVKLKQKTYLLRRSEELFQT